MFFDRGYSKSAILERYFFYFPVAFKNLVITVVYKHSSAYAVLKSKK